MANIKKHGGARPGAGRKSASLEGDVKRAILKAIQEDPEVVDRVWRKIIDKAENGSYLHAQLFLNYAFGKPIEQVKVMSSQMIISREIISE